MTQDEQSLREAIEFAATVTMVPYIKGEHQAHKIITMKLDDLMQLIQEHTEQAVKQGVLNALYRLHVDDLHEQLDMGLTTRRTLRQLLDHRIAILSNPTKEGSTNPS